jgi:hypothetical protein
VTARGRGALETLVRPAVFAPVLAILGLCVSATFVDRGLPSGDEGAVLGWAGRILRGDVFYREVDAYPFPGAAYLLAGWMKVFGESINAGRWLAAFVFSLLLVGLYASAIQLLDRWRAALFGLGLLSLKFLAWPAFTAYFYSDLSLCFASFAIALLVGHAYQGPSLRLFAAGALVGLATASKQSLGIFLAIAATLLLARSPLLLRTSQTLRRSLEEAAVFALGWIAALTPMLGYFFSQGLLKTVIDSALVRPLVAYLPTSGISFLEPLAWWQLGSLRETEAFPYFVAAYWSLLMTDGLPVGAGDEAYWVAGELFSRLLYTSIVIVFPVAAWRWGRALWKRDITGLDRRLFTFTALSAATLLSAFPRADFFHVISVYPVVLLLFFALRGHTLSRHEMPIQRPPRLCAAAIALLLLVTGVLAAFQRAPQSFRLEVPRARLYIDPSQAWIQSILGYLDENLGPDDLLFVYGHEAYYYFLTGHYYPWPFVQLYPGQAGGDAGASLVDLLRRQPPKIVVRGVMEWPGVPAIRSYTQAVHPYLGSRYSAEDRLFERHPPRAGSAPPGWMVQVLQARRGP